MSDFLNSIKITDEDKKKAISKMIYTAMISSNVLSLEEILRKQTKNGKTDNNETQRLIEETLNPNELLAAYSLAKEIKISMMNSSKKNKKLFKYLELNFGSINEDNLLKFINEAAKDIEIIKKRNPNMQWNLQVGKIFSRLEGKNLCEEEILKQESDNSKKDNIIKLSDHVEK